jgi:hypothetical protein
MDSARVYEGQYGSTSVAIKINKVPFGVDEESTDVFLKEMAILLAGQNHPNGSTSPFVHIPHFASRVFIESGSFYIAFRRPCFGTPLLSVFVDCFLLSTFVPVTLPPPSLSCRLPGMVLLQSSDFTACVVFLRGLAL